MKTKLLVVSLITTQLHLFAGPDKAPAAPGYVAHEWGTFTSVQGADGVQFDWNPFVVWDLPEFVYNRNRTPNATNHPALFALGTKRTTRARQRMETPVIYFYSDQPRQVDVEVQFPEGLITEWYPQVTTFAPYAATNAAEVKEAGRSFIRWQGVQVAPASTHPAFSALLPGDDAPNHYYAARATDADYVRVPAGTTAAQPLETEKFLFYRGVGSFNAPLAVSMAGGEDALHLHNSGEEAFGAMFVIQLRQGEGRFLELEGLQAKRSQRVKLDQAGAFSRVPELQYQLGVRMGASLVRAGLYPKEAEAMVETWRDSWFSEDGVRVLYLLPRAWTDRMLPLALDPAPTERVRVMVGRAEVITPSMEWNLVKHIVRFGDADPAQREQIGESARQMGLGRFAEPTLRRVLGSYPSREFSEAGWKLIDVLQPAARVKEGFAAW